MEVLLMVMLSDASTPNIQQVGKEVFWLARDLLRLFHLGQKYGIYTSPSYNLRDAEQVVQRLVRKLRELERDIEWRLVL